MQNGVAFQFEYRYVTLSRWRMDGFKTEFVALTKLFIVERGVSQTWPRAQTTPMPVSPRERCNRLTRQSMSHREMLLHYIWRHVSPSNHRYIVREHFPTFPTNPLTPQRHRRHEHPSGARVKNWQIV